MTKKLADIQWRPPTIKTKRLVLRGWEPSDVEAVYEYASDPAVAEFMAWDRHSSLADARFFLDQITAPQYVDQELSYAICLQCEPDRAIGGVGLSWNPKSEGVLELGYVLHQKHWGEGLMVEACSQLIPLAWEETIASRIFAPVMAENAKSRRLAEKLGMHLDGVLRSHIERRGLRRDMAIYSLLRDELVR